MVWFDKILRSLFGTIDGILGWAASTLYTLIVQIANVDIFGNYIYTMMGRIYTFLAIFMLFKLSISVVNYVLNPDQLTDKSKGFGKLIQNVIIVMALIIMTPQIFNWAYKLQAAILNTNVLYTIVTGNPNDSSYDPSDLQGLTSKEIVAILTKNAEDSGDMIKYELLSTFIYNKHSEDEHTAVKSDGTLCNKETTGSYSAAYDCLMDGDTINNTSGSSSDKHYGAKKGFRNEYKILVSTLCIGFAAYVFLVTAFDVALRCVKLGALQLMAPVPIISMLDPNSGKSGMFSKWLKECKNTYLSLFTRLISVYFAVEVIRGLTEPGRFVWYGTDVAVGFGFVKVFVILGLLMFAKQLPKFIEDATGIKMDTGGLNLKKKLDSVPGLNRATAGAMGLAGGIAANAIAARNNFKGQGFKGFAKGLGSSLAGGISGMNRGIWSKEKNAWKAGQGAIKGAVDKRNLRDQRQATGYTFGKRMEAGVNTFAGLDPMQKYENEIKEYDEFGKQAGEILTRASSEMIKYGDLALSNGFTMALHKKEKELLTALENRDTSKMTDLELDAHTKKLSDLRDRVNINNKKFEKAYIGAVMSGATLHKSDGTAVNMGDENDSNRDEQLISRVEGLVNTCAMSSNEDIKNIKLTDQSGNYDIKAANESVSSKKLNVINSTEYKRALQNKKSK